MAAVNHSLPREADHFKIETRISEHNHPRTEIVDVATRNDGKNKSWKKESRSRASIPGRSNHQYAQDPKDGYRPSLANLCSSVFICG